MDNIKYFVNGPVNVDWAKKDFKWWFQYTTSATGLPGNARWEISRTPFVDWAEWKPTDGYGYAGVADATMFPIDLKPYAPIPGYLATAATVPGPPKTLMQAPSKPANASPVPDIPGQSTPPPSGASSKPGTGGTQVMAGAKQPAPAATGPALAAAQAPFKLPPLQSLYVRVVPLDASGKDADLPSNAVELKFGPAEKAPPFELDPEMWPQITFLPDEYRPVQAYTSDWQCWVKATQSMHFLGGDIKKGELSNSCHHDSDPVSDFMDAVGGFIGLLKEFVNGVSSAFNTLKGIATSAIVSALGCSKNATCQALISAGINGGMVALGMPPSLPDFDALQAMGEDYLAETIAQQVASQTGIPFADEATKLAVKDLIDKGKEAAASGGGGGSSMFWIPDDGHQYKPLVVMLSVSNPGTKNTAAMYLEVAETSTRYKNATLPIPRLQPNQSLKIAVALQATKDPKAWMALLPTTDDVAALDVSTVVKKQQRADAALNAWRTEYLSGTVTFRAKLMLSPFDKQVFERSCLAAKAWCVVQ